MSRALGRRLRHAAQFLDAPAARHGVQELPPEVVVLLQTAVQLGHDKPLTIRYEMLF